MAINKFFLLILWQDTVVALQALANFANVALQDVNMTVKVEASGLTQTYNVDSLNSLVLQKRVVSHCLSSVMFGYLYSGWSVCSNHTEVISSVH